MPPDLLTPSGVDANLESRPLNVIVLDDDEFDRRRVCRMMRRFDKTVSVTAVASIEDMVTNLETQRFDLFLIDYMLQDATGLDALDHLQGDHFSSATKIMLSGYQRTEVAVAAMKKGCVDFIGKDDLSVEVLEEKVTMAMSRVSVEVAPAPIEMDNALRQFAAQHLPTVFAEALASDVVQATLRPHLEQIIENSFERALAAVESKRGPESGDEMQSLFAALHEELRIGGLSENVRG